MKKIYEVVECNSYSDDPDFFENKVLGEIKANGIEEALEIAKASGYSKGWTIAKVREKKTTPLYKWTVQHIDGWLEGITADTYVNFNFPSSKIGKVLKEYSGSQVKILACVRVR